MQRGFLCLLFIANLLCALTIHADEVASDTYLHNWLKNSEHYAQEKVTLEGLSHAIVSIPTPSAQAAQKIASVLNAVHKHDKQVQQDVINALEASNLIANKDGSTQRTALAKLCQHANPTLLGKISLADMLVHSSPDFELIRSRQEVIQALCNNDALREKLVSLRSACAKSLDSMHMFQSQLLFVSSIPLPVIKEVKFLGISLCKDFECVGTGATLSRMAALKSYHQEGILANMLFWSMFGARASRHKLKGTAINMTAGLVGDAAMRLITFNPGSIVYDLYKKYTQPNKVLDSCLDFCSYNHHMLNFCLQLKTLSNQYSEIKKIQSLSYLDDFEQKIKSDSGLKRFVDLLKKEPHRLWQYEQHVLITLAHKYQQELVGLYAIAGETEAYLAVAQTKKHFEGHDNLKMAFTEFINDNSTKLEMKNVWNPSLDDDKAVPNSLAFNDAAKNHKILTGSNMGGKSTLIKAIIANLMLSQTFGVAFAQDMRHQPIDQWLISLNTTDNTGKESLFEAEINKAAHMLTRLRNNRDKNSLVVCDELFVGTSSTDAALAAKTVALEIAKANAASIFATHHGKIVTDLGTAAQTPFANIKMDAIQDEQGRTIYTYQCKDGISQENIARKLFEERIGVPMVTE